MRLLRVLTTYNNRLLLHDNHLAVLTAVKENSVRFLRNFYTGQLDFWRIKVISFDFEIRNKRGEANLNG